LSAFGAWNFHCFSKKLHLMRWCLLADKLSAKKRSRSFTALTTQLTSDRLSRIQEQTLALKNQLLEFMEEDESRLEHENIEQIELRQQLVTCRQERDSALIECEFACEAAAAAKSENIKSAELMLTYRLQISHLTDELECYRQQCLQVNILHDDMKLQCDQATASLVCQQQILTCNSELQRMVASADAVAAGTSTALESVQCKLQAALAEAELLTAAKVAADATCEAVLRQLEQSSSIQSQQKESIRELSNSLSGTKLELHSVLSEHDRTLQEILELKRSLSASILQIGQLTDALEANQTQAMQRDAAFTSLTRELSSKDEYIRVLMESLESSGKERQRLKMQVQFCFFLDSVSKF
jgi:hypothetical protein